MNTHFAGGRSLAFVKYSVVLAFVAAACFWVGSRVNSQTARTMDGPADQGPRMSPGQRGNKDSGREVFRFETFGTEAFWTDAVRMPQGMVAAKVTPVQAIELGLHVDVDALDSATKRAVAAEIKADPSLRSSKLLNDPMTTVKLLNANAIIGVPIKDSNGDGRMDAMAGDKVGVSCALCHSTSDGSVFKKSGGGGIGKRMDNFTAYELNVGKILATAANSRALYPTLQLALDANGGRTLGRAPVGLTEKSTEAEVDAYLSNPQFYPAGMFDDTFDGNGDPMHNVPFFEQDLAGPFGSEGLMDTADNFSNLVFTGLFDMTGITTPSGRAFMNKLGGPAGDEIVEDYIKILRETGVTGYPFVRASAHPQPGSLMAPLGVRVDNQKLIDMNAYVFDLQAPNAIKTDSSAIGRGRRVFQTEGCTMCHNVDQRRPVPTTIVDMKTIFPGDNPDKLADRMPPLNPVLNTQSSFFDDKMAIVNASIRGEKRGNALPLLFELFRKNKFLHDSSVSSLDMLFTASRGTIAPHPFYVPDARNRGDLVAFLRSLDSRR